MFSADNSGLIIVWGTKVMPGSRRGLTSQWSIERVNAFSNIAKKRYINHNLN